MNEGYRYLPWRLKFLLILGSIIAFFFFNYFIVSKVKTNDLFIYSEQVKETKRHEDSIKWLGKKIDSVTTIYDLKIDSLKAIDALIDSLGNEKIRLDKDLRRVEDSITSAKKRKTVPQSSQ